MSVIKLTLPLGELPVNGKQITFKAPCSCKDTVALEIEGEQYTVVDALCKCVTGAGGKWEVGSTVSVILDTENKYAYLQNGAGGISAEVAAAYGLEADATVSDAFGKLSEAVQVKTIVYPAGTTNWESANFPTNSENSYAMPVAIKGTIIQFAPLVEAVDADCYFSRDGGVSWQKASMMGDKLVTVAAGNGEIVYTTYTNSDSLYCGSVADNGSVDFESSARANITGDSAGYLSVGFDGVRFIACSNAVGCIATNPKPSTTAWTKKKTDGVRLDSSWNSASCRIVGENGRSLIVYNRLANYDCTSYYYSLDGETWQRGTLPFTRALGVAAGDGIFAAYDDVSQSVYTSTDLVNWTLAASRVAIMLSFANGYFWSYDNSCVLYRSRDCVSWETVANMSDYVTVSLATTYTGHPATVVYDDVRDIVYAVSGGHNWAKPGARSTTKITNDLVKPNGEVATGKVLDALGSARIAMGSYTGTGTYNASNPNSLTFDFEPKMVVIGLKSSPIHGGFPWFKPVNEFRSYLSGSTAGAVYITWGENSISWYNTSSANYQLNVSGNTYYYIAIG